MHTSQEGNGLRSISDAAERRRLVALRDLGLLDTPFEERFDRITRTAAALFEVPKAAVSLVDVNRQWFKACVGIDERETSLEASLCATAIRGEGQLVIEDAAADPRFAEHPAVVGDPWVRFYAGQPLRLPSGEVPGTLCIFDTEPRRFSEADAVALRDLAAIVESELTSEGVESLLRDVMRVTARVRAVADAATEGIVVLTMDGRVEFANDSAEAALGHPPGGLAGADLHATVHAGDECGEDCALRCAIARGERMPSERGAYRRRDGRTIPVEHAAAPVSERGEVTGVVVTFADVSTQVELERVKDEFAAHVTHDLRSPLTAIRGYAEILRDDAGEDDREPFDAILRSTGRLESLIDDLLHLSRLDDARTELAREPVDLAELVRELAADLGAEAEARSLRIDVEAPAELVVAGDREQLERALANIASNATKFSPDGGTVTIRAGASGATATVAVSDQGPGIPAGELDQLGDRFFRASTSEGVKGTGLGLAITREVADRHGGAMRVASELGAGSTFTVELPLAGS